MSAFPSEDLRAGRRTERVFRRTVVFRRLLDRLSEGERVRPHRIDRRGELPCACDSPGYTVKVTPSVLLSHGASRRRSTHQFLFLAIAFSASEDALSQPLPSDTPANQVPVCPFCQSTAVTTAAKTVNDATYWRCGACGEVWNVARLQQGTSSRSRRPW